MPSFVTPKINTEYIFYMSLPAQAGKIMQVNPTLASGDVLVSTDGSSDTNLDTLPVVTPASSKKIKVTVSAAEMNGNNVTITFSDAAGDQWNDVTINIQTTAAQIDDIKNDTAAILVDTGTTLDGKIDVIDGIVDTILVDTADMQPRVVAIEIDTGTTLDGKINTIDGIVDSILVDTGTTLDTKLNDIQGATFSSATDSLEAIRDRGDAEWTTGAGGSDRLLLVDTTIATLSTQTSFTLSAGSADNDAYNNCTIVVEDVATATQKAIGMVLDYVGSTKTVTLKEALAFTISTTDKVYILAENSLKSTVANRQLDVTATGAAGIDWANVENPTTSLDLSGTDIQLVDTTNVNTDMRGTDGANTTVPDNAGITAILLDTGTTLPATLSTIEGKLDTVDGIVDTILIDTANMQPKLGTPAGASISADIAVIEGQTDDIGVAGAGLTALATQASVNVIDGIVDTILTDTADIQPRVVAIEIDTGTTLDTKLDDIQGATFSSGTDSLEAIRNRGDAEWVTGAGALTAAQDASLTNIEDIAEADEEYTATTAIKRHKVTKAVLVSKNVSGGNIPSTITIDE